MPTEPSPMTLAQAVRRAVEVVDPEQLIRLAARAEWEGDPPDAVSVWLAERGIKI